MGSSRLPGKVLRPLAGRTVLGWVVRAAAGSGLPADVVVATTEEPADDAVVRECDRLGVAAFRGSAADVLGRFVGALAAHPGDAVLRLTADCPLLDPALIAAAGRAFAALPGLDYLSTLTPRTLPRGLDVEIIGADALRRVAERATGHHRAHVTSYVYTHPREFSLLGLTFAPPADRLRVTLDTIEDWRVLEAIVAEFGDRPVPMRTLTGWLEANPQVTALNAGVRQKPAEQA